MYLESSKSKKTFSFLHDQELEEELYLSYAYIKYLTGILDSGTVGELHYIEYSIAHNIAIYFGGMLEAMLNKYVFCYLKKYGTELDIKKYCKTIEYKEKTQVIPSLKDPSIGIVYCERSLKMEDFKDNINFNFLIKGCRDRNLFSVQVLEALDKIRKVRNGVHLNTIMEIKNIYSYKDLRNITADVKIVFSELKQKYSEL